MTIFEVSNSEEPPLTALGIDWFGGEVAPPAFYSFAIDGRDLVFRASREAAARCHPDARPGGFPPGLWKYDVAEFFLSDPARGIYLECNLSPNGAHWTCLFDSPRRVHSETPDIGARSEGSCVANGWCARVALPLAWLEKHLHFGATTRMNAAFILNSPDQQFLTCVPLGRGEPDFHRPDCYSTHCRIKLA